MELTDIDWRAVVAGGGVEVVALGGLLGLDALRGRLLSSVVLFLLVGALGGVVAGRLVTGGFEEKARHGALSGLVGGAFFAAVFWYVVNTPGAPRGAFWSLAYLVTFLPIPPEFGARYGELVVGILALVGWLVIAGAGYVAGGATGSRALPDHPES